MRQLLPLLICIFLYSCSNPVKDVGYINDTKYLKNKSNDRYLSVTILKEYDSAGLHISRTEVINDLSPQEIRDINPENRSMTVVACAALYTNPKNIDDRYKNLKSITLIILGSTFSIFASIWFFHYSKDRQSHHEKIILMSEIRDVRRHLRANLRWIKKIDLNNGIPLSFYFNRMKSFSNMILNSEDTYRSVPHNFTPILSHIRIHIRNYNIEVEEFVKNLECRNNDIAVLKEHQEFIKTKTLFLISWLGLVNSIKHNRKSYYDEFRQKELTLKKKQEFKVIYYEERKTNCIDQRK